MLFDSQIINMTYVSNLYLSCEVKIFSKNFGCLVWLIFYFCEIWSWSKFMLRLSKAQQNSITKPLGLFKLETYSPKIFFLEILWMSISFFVETSEKILLLFQSSRDKYSFKIIKNHIIIDPSCDRQMYDRLIDRVNDLDSNI